MLAKDMSHPYKRLVDYEHRGFARWFWKENALEGEVVCLHTDLGKFFYTPRAPEDYLCYQRVYSASSRTPRNCSRRKSGKSHGNSCRFPQFS